MLPTPQLRPTPHATRCAPRPATCRPPAHTRCWPVGSVEIVAEVRAGAGGPLTGFHVVTLIDPDRTHLVPATIVHESAMPCVLTDFLARRAKGERG